MEHFIALVQAFAPYVWPLVALRIASWTRHSPLWGKLAEALVERFRQMKSSKVAVGSASAEWIFESLPAEAQKALPAPVPNSGEPSPQRGLLKQSTNLVRAALQVLAGAKGPRGDAGSIGKLSRMALDAGTIDSTLATALQGHSAKLEEIDSLSDAEVELAYHFVLLTLGKLARRHPGLIAGFADGAVGGDTFDAQVRRAEANS